MEIKTKICKRCNTEKDDFSSKAVWCRDCRKAYDKERRKDGSWDTFNKEKANFRKKMWAESHRQKHLARNKKWKTKHPIEYKASWRNYQLKMWCGANLELYNRMLVEQNFVCAICGNKNVGKKSLAIDHCHTTGKIRGLLCNKCNTGIGLFKDSVRNLYRAVEYLLK